MPSKQSFVVGFKKTAGPVTNGLKSVGKTLLNAAGGPVGAGFTLLDAATTGKAGYNKMVAAGTR